MTFDPTKPVQTRDGRKARIIATDLDAEQNIVAIVEGPDGKEYVETYCPNGHLVKNKVTVSDLINIPEKITRWGNIYKPYFLDAICIHDTRSMAEEHKDEDRVGLLELTFENGIPVDVKLHKDQPK
jgi:hypothetical protein